MKQINLNIKTFSLAIPIFSLLFIFLYEKNSKAFDSEYSKAFAEFIQVLYNNTQTATGKANNLCVFGDDDISSQLLARSKTINLTEATAKKVRDKDCRLVYVAKNKERFVKSFIDDINKSGVATVATFDSFTNNGGMISVDVGRRDFELTVNVGVLKKSGVKLDSSITGLIVER